MSWKKHPIDIEDGTYVNAFNDIRDDPHYKKETSIIEK